MIAWGLRIRVAASKRGEVLAILRGLVEPSRASGGCLDCRAYQAIGDLDVLSIVQEWAGWDDLERYLHSEDYPKLVAVMELAAQRPEIWFDTISSREGLERLAALRGAPAEPR
jgi:quinol monooxygenase YgiN